MSEDRPRFVEKPNDGKYHTRDSYKPDWPADEGYTWVCTIFGTWIQLDNPSVGVPCVDPSFERYYCM